VGWIGKRPIVSLSIAGAMLFVAFGPGREPAPADDRFEQAREEARILLQRNRTLAVDAIGEGVLGPSWLEETLDPARDEGAERAGDRIVLPPRLQARSQARLDALIDEAHRVRLEMDPVWRFGVQGGSSPPRNYLAHAFVHEAWTGLALVVVMVILAGAPLERVWGSLFFGVFALGALPLTASIHRLLEPGGGLPWHGGAGLVGAVLGAYFVRGLGGHFLLPGWLLLPVWLGLEVFVVREFWLDDLAGVPWATLSSSIGLGALVAGGTRLLGVESKLDAHIGSRSETGLNPILARAARLRTDGDPHQAFELVQAAWRDDPRDEDVARVFFEIAVEVGRPQAAANAILPSLGRLLRQGEVSRALAWWLPLARVEAEVDIEATAALRLGEALLDSGHPDEALFSLRRALSAGVSSAQATRIVRVARDLDEELTRRAAQIALADPSLDPEIRADLASLVPPEVVEPAAPTVRNDSGSVDPHEASLIAQELDPGALSPESFEGGEAPAPTDTGSDSESQSGDVPSDWNDPGRIDDLSDALAVDESAARTLFSSQDLESIDAGLELTDEVGSGDGFAAGDDPDPGPDPGPEHGDDRDRGGRRMPDPREAETDSDMTPMMEATSDLGAPSSASSSAAAAAGTAGLRAEADPRHGATEPVGPPPNPPTPDVPGRPSRRLKALDAVPISADASSIEIDVDSRGKSKLPVDRIDAIALAAVVGLASRPVLIVDFVLNWEEGPDEALKVIRLRSDRFDPRRFQPDAATPLQALLDWLTRIQETSAALCLPSREILEGRFARFDSLDAYARAVLRAGGSHPPRDAR